MFDAFALETIDVGGVALRVHAHAGEHVLQEALWVSIAEVGRIGGGGERGTGTGEGEPAQEVGSAPAGVLLVEPVGLEAVEARLELVNELLVGQQSAVGCAKGAGI